MPWALKMATGQSSFWVSYASLLASLLSFTSHALDFAYAFHYMPPVALRPQSVQRVILTVFVIPSLMSRVQEYLPAFHPLRLSASR